MAALHRRQSRVPAAVLDLLRHLRDRARTVVPGAGYGRLPSTP
jgi:hypothetical protein